MHKEDRRDDSMLPCCCVCGIELSTTDWACFECKWDHSLKGSISNWPEWARFLRTNEEMRRRRIVHPVDVLDLA